MTGPVLHSVAHLQYVPQFYFSAVTASVPLHVLKRNLTISCGLAFHTEQAICKCAEDDWKIL